LNNTKSLQDAWKALRNGDPISDSDLLAMRDQLQAALPYLSDRLPEFYLAWVATNRELIEVQDYINARGLLPTDRKYENK
jgi:hypothetical protein